MHAKPSLRVPRELVSALVAVAGRWRDPEHPTRARAVAATMESPNRFTQEAVAFAINQQMHQLTAPQVEAWIEGRQAREPRTVGVLNPGNVPLVELQDFLAVLLTGHRYFGVMSSASPHLLPAFAGEVRSLAGASEFPYGFGTLDGMLSASEAVIATGSDATRDRLAELCEAAGIPSGRRLLRGNRFAVAVIDGRESADELEGLAEDMLLHEGLGCRNVAIVWAPADASPDPLLEALAAFRGVFPPHGESAGALKLQQAFLKATDTPHAHGENLEFLVSRGVPEVQPPGHVRWTEYHRIDEVTRWMTENEQTIQLVVARERLRRNLETELEVELEVVSPGNAQRPALSWRPDRINTVSFLANL